MKWYKQLTPKQKLRIIFYTAGKDVATRYDQYGIRLLDDSDKEAILLGLRKLFKHNNINFWSDKISDYFYELSKLEDFDILIENEE